MGFVAIRRIKVQQGDEVVTVLPGERVYAEDWPLPARRAALACERIREVLIDPPSPGRGRERHALVPGIQVS
jgi:hypothetical protein